MSFFNIYDSLPGSSLASFDSIIPPKLHRRVMRAISMGPNLHEKNSLLTWEIAIDFIPKHPNARLSILPSCQCIVTLLSHQVTHPCCQPIPSLLSIYNFETVFHIPSSHLNLSISRHNSTTTLHVNKHRHLDPKQLKASQHPRISSTLMISPNFCVFFTPISTSLRKKTPTFIDDRFDTKAFFCQSFLDPSASLNASNDTIFPKIQSQQKANYVIKHEERVHRPKTSRRYTDGFVAKYRNPKPSNQQPTNPSSNPPA